MNKKLTVKEVLKNIDESLAELTTDDLHKSLTIRYVYEKFNIFDWFKYQLTITNLRDMRRFLKEAEKLGYTGTCSFKVGASCCANGMWAFKEGPTENGFDPDGDCLYKSFTPDYNSWSFKVGNNWNNRSYTNVKDLEEAITITNTVCY